MQNSELILELIGNSLLSPIKMSPIRRSKRLRGSSAIPATSTQTPSNLLDSLSERAETQTQGAQTTLDAIVSSPLVPRTPATSGRIKPGLEEMHPSKVHHSTTKGPDSGLRLGFMDVNAKANNQPSGINQHTPSKLGTNSSTFDFHFARPGPQLGLEAQRMMDELREEALRIKAKLAAEREEEKRNRGEDTNTGVGGRKIAQPKGKVGRFSDIHMAEFKRMDSIAGHPSAFRAQPGRLTPATAGLKRTQSKARLDETEENQLGQTTQQSTGRIENTAPAKRARQLITDDISSTRPYSRDGTQPSKLLPSTPATPRGQAALQSFITTPTQASLARSASVKQLATHIPTLSRSPSKLNLNGTPRTLPKSSTVSNLTSIPKSDLKGYLRSPGRFNRAKSILRHPSFGSKKVSAKPPLARSPSRPNLDMALPTNPKTPSGIENSKSVKHVNFTPDTVTKHVAMVQNSPSPMKSGIPRSTSKINLGSKSHSSGRSEIKEVEYPYIAHHLGAQSEKIVYPSLVTPRPLPEPPSQIKSGSRPPPSVPGTFTFRSDHTIDFGASPRGFGSSPGQASVRQVRPSIASKSMPGSFPDVDKENIENLPAVSHGISNKKRRRVDSDEEGDTERSPKKCKASVAEGPMLMAEKMAPKSKIPSPAKKRVLSLSRLNMLARPKMRQ